MRSLGKTGLVLLLALSTTACDSGGTACSKACSKVKRCMTPADAGAGGDKGTKTSGTGSDSGSGSPSYTCPYSDECSAKEDCHAQCVTAASCDAILGKDPKGAAAMVSCRSECDNKTWDTGTPKPDGGQPKPDTGTCQPKCDSKKCGDNGCGGSCGTCDPGHSCDPAGQCIPGCQPSCEGKVCGDNGCGGSCGTCPGGDTCNTAGQCEPGCVPNCTGKVCGDNGCGGTCGTCTGGDTCNTAGQCAPVGGCGSVSYEGCCDGATLKYCDSNQIKTLDCAANPNCGWSSSAGVYDCGTSGGSDPSGKFAKTCP